MHLFSSPLNIFSILCFTYTQEPGCTAWHPPPCGMQAPTSLATECKFLTAPRWPGPQELPLVTAPLLSPPVAGKRVVQRPGPLASAHAWLKGHLLQSLEDWLRPLLHCTAVNLSLCPLLLPLPK